MMGRSTLILGGAAIALGAALIAFHKDAAAAADCNVVCFGALYFNDSNRNEFVFEDTCYCDILATTGAGTGAGELPNQYAPSDGTIICLGAQHGPNGMSMGPGQVLGNWSMITCYEECTKGT